MSTTATVAFVPLRTDLANLPSDLTGMLFNSNVPVQNIVLELSFQQGLRSESKVYLGWTGMSSAAPKTIEVDPTFAQNVKLPYNAKVSIKVHVNAPVAHTVHLEPTTTADWEIVETHVSYIESWMINQVRAVSTVHPITLYPSNTAIASLQVTKIEPPPSGPFAKLGPDSEVIVAPKVKRAPVKSAEKFEKKTVRKPVEAVAVVRSAAYPYGLKTGQLATQDSVAATRQLVLYGDFPAFADYDSVSVTVVKPAGISEPTTKPDSKTEDELQPAKTVVAKLVQGDRQFAIPTLSYGLSCALKITDSVGSLIKVSAPPSQIDSGTVTLHPYTTSSAPSSLKLGSSDKNQQISAALLAQIDLSHTSNGLVIPPSDDLVTGGILEASFEYGKIDKIVMGSETVIAESQVLPKLSELDSKPARKVVGRDALLKQTLETCLSSSGGTLAYGSRGCGKTAVVNEIKQALKQRLVTPLVFSTGAVADKPIPTIREALKRLFLEAAWYAPSLVIIEDIENLIPTETEHSDSGRTQQIAAIFRSSALQAISKRPVTILASAQSKEAVHSSLLSSHLFEELVHIRSPDKHVREAVLKEAMSSLGLAGDADFDILDVAGETEGYQPGDLWVLVERVAASVALRADMEVLNFEDDQVDGVANGKLDAATNDTSDKQIVSLDMFLQATSDYTPASLRGVKLEKPAVKWSDIGGMNEVKRVILETLEWPTKYAPIFAKSTLRLRSGLLLYGYPGCGKTLLASAIAAQTGLNFISVKGPEILNKYIGASEQSVRELFDRAQAAKPCVLFFDEFDSIAPKRGHDSTGVTDRVVNQMLTQMDGAEGLDGVYVLAATSRPDLIDSALLRPGRLDKSLLCDMPSYEDRLEIISTAQQKMKLASDVDLQKIAQDTEGFSGADLQAIMTNAYLDAIHNVVDLNVPAEDSKKRDLDIFQVGGDPKTVNFDEIKNYIKVNNEESIEEATVVNGATENNVVVTAANIGKSLTETKPSISSKEVAKLRNIYQQFVADRDGQMPPGTPSNDIGGRVTLS